MLFHDWGVANRDPWLRSQEVFEPRQVGLVNLQSQVDPLPEFPRCARPWPVRIPAVCGELARTALLEVGTGGALLLWDVKGNTPRGPALATHEMPAQEGAVHSEDREAPAAVFLAGCHAVVCGGWEARRSFVASNPRAHRWNFQIEDGPHVFFIANGSISNLCMEETEQSTSSIWQATGGEKIGIKIGSKSERG